MEFFSASLELKSVDVSQRVIKGYAAIHHTVDRVHDIIDPSATVKALARIKDPKTIPLFIGHQHSDLPTGHAVVLEAHPRGLYTEHYVYEGPAGDNALAVAKDMQDHGVSLGMSIGYKTHDSRNERNVHGRVRRLLDYELKENSLAAQQTIANPDALVFGLKTIQQYTEWEAELARGGTVQSNHQELNRFQAWREHKAMSEGSDGGGGFVVPPDQKEATMEQCCAACKALGAHSPDCTGDGCGGMDDDACDCALSLSDMGNGPARDDQLGAEGMTAPMPGKKKTVESKAVWTGKYVDALPNSSFLFVEPGEDDGDGKRVPRSKRHFPIKDADGKVDLAHLRDAIGRIPQSNAPGLDDAKKANLQARARHMLESADDGKTYDEADEWKTGAPIQVRALAYRLLDLSEQIATEHKAMALLGEDTKEYHRMRKPVRDDLTLVSLDLKRLLEWSDTIERGADAEATITRFKAAAAIFDFI